MATTQRGWRLQVTLVLLVVGALLLFSLALWQARSNRVTQLPVIGYTNVNGAACFIIAEPYPLRGLVINSWLIPKRLQPVVLYSEASFECHSFDRDGHPAHERLPGSSMFADPPLGKQFLILPDTTNRWQYSIQHTQSLRIANKHILDLRRGTLVTPMQEPTLPKARLPK
jgi:hypothetical protein